MLVPLSLSECPQFESCSCNVCPLDPDQGLRLKLPEDDPCTAQRGSREKIAARYPGALALGGLTPREIIHDKRSRREKAKWLAMPEAKRRAFLKTSFGAGQNDPKTILQPPPGAAHDHP